MENNTPSPKKFANVILFLTQEMHCHVHVAKYPHTFTLQTPTDVELANISKEREALASEYADAISLLTSVSNAVSEVEALKQSDAQKLQDEQVLLDQNSGENIQETNPQNS